MKKLSGRSTVNTISEYVQNYARYNEDAPKLKYSCKHPNPFATQSVFSNDTWDLVVQLAKIYNVVLDKD